MKHQLFFFLSLFLIQVSTEASPNKSNLLTQAIKSKNAKEVKLLLTHGADPSLPDEQNQLALFLATEFGEKEIVKQLLEYKTDPNQKNSYGDTALFKTSATWRKSKASLQIAELLLDAGADPNLANETGNLPLHIASFYGNTKAVLLLLKRGANVNQTNFKKQSPLHWVSFYGQSSINHNEVTDLLLNAGVKVNVKDKSGNTALHQACFYGSLTIIKRLIAEEDIDLNVQNNKGITPLISAIYSRSPKVVKLLLEKGASPSLETQQQKKPLDYAKEENLFEIIELLIEYGA